MAAHVRHVVHRHLVLRRPAQLRLEPEALARPRLEPRVALGGVGLAGLVALAAHEQPLAVRADRVGRRLGGEVHPGRRVPLPPRHDVRALRMAACEVQAPVQERQVRGHHHVIRAHPRAARRAQRAGVEPRDPGALVERAAQRRGEPVGVLHRVELGLVVEAHRAGDREREIQLLGERRRQAQLARDLGLLAQLSGLRGVLRVRVVRLAAKLAVDPELLGELEDARDPGLVGLAVGARHVHVVLRGQARVREPVERAELRGVVTRRSRRHVPHLQDRHARALALQEQRRREPDDPGAHDRDVDRDVLGERGVLRPLPALEPE